MTLPPADGGDPPPGRGDSVRFAVQSRRVVLIGWAFAVCSLVMVPWTVGIFLTLPTRQQSHHYDLAWGGFDVGLMAVLAFTAYAAVRRSRWLAVAASVTAALLVTDAWFDVVTAPRPRERLLAIAMAAVVELPLAAICIWLSLTGQELAEHQVALALRRRYTPVRRTKR